MATLETKHEMNNLNVEDKPEKGADKGIDQCKSILSILSYSAYYKYTFNKYTTILDFFGGGIM